MNGELEEEDDNIGVTEIHKELFKYFDLKNYFFNESITIKADALNYNYKIPSAKMAGYLEALSFLEVGIENLSFTEFYYILCSLLQEFSVIFVSNNARRLSGSV